MESFRLVSVSYPMKRTKIAHQGENIIPGNTIDLSALIWYDISMMASDLSELPASEFPIPADQAGRLPVSERVAAILSDRIRSGVYHTGDLLPAERALAADLQVHRRSVRTAIDQLVQEGLLSRRPNCRPTVGPPSPTPRKAATRRAPEGTARRTLSRISTSNLVALLMWHGGGPLEHAGTSQQRIFWGMNQSLTKLGYHAVFLDLGEQIGSEEENAVREAVHLRYIQDQGFGGAIFYPYAYRSNSALVQEVSRTVPLVLLDRKIPGCDADFVGLQNHSAMFKAAQHLIAQGHRRIAYLTHSEPIQSVQDRVQGYLDAMRSVGLPDIQEMILNIPPYGDDPRAWTVVDAVFRLPEPQRPTAAVCLNDYLAVSLAERLEYLGLSIPQDAAVTGFDNIVPTLPSGIGLTTVAQPYEEIGLAAVELLMRRIKDRRLPAQSVELPAQLMVRASSAS